MVKMADQILKDPDVATWFRPEPPHVHYLRQSLKDRAVSVPSNEALCLFCVEKLDGTRHKSRSGRMHGQILEPTEENTCRHDIFHIQDEALPTRPSMGITEIYG